MLILPENLKELDDFYLYYSRTGRIEAITKNPLASWNDVPYLRIPAEFGTALITGKELPSAWTVSFNEKAQQMELLENVNSLPKPNPFINIPRSQKNPDIIITWDGNAFRFAAPGIQYTVNNPRLLFFVTNLDDPHIVHQFLECYLVDILDGNVVIEGVDIPTEFSIFTKGLFKYRLVIKK